MDRRVSRLSLAVLLLSTTAGRRHWRWPYKESVNMIRWPAWTALGVRRVVPANRPPDDRFHR